MAELPKGTKVVCGCRVSWTAMRDDRGGFYVDIRTALSHSSIPVYLNGIQAKDLEASAEHMVDAFVRNLQAMFVCGERARAAAIRHVLEVRDG
jgi:hypothetical protein